MLRGLEPRRHREMGCWKEKTPARCLVSTWQRIGLPLQQGGCMTLAQLGMVLWDDLAAPVIAGILVSMIVSWMDNRK